MTNQSLIINVDAFDLGELAQVLGQVQIAINAGVRSAWVYNEKGKVVGAFELTEGDSDG
jgi:hypothetical protein